MKKSRFAICVAIITVLSLVLAGCACSDSGAKKPSAEDAKIMSGNTNSTANTSSGNTSSDNTSGASSNAAGTAVSAGNNQSSGNAGGMGSATPTTADLIGKWNSVNVTYNGENSDTNVGSFEFLDGGRVIYTSDNYSVDGVWELWGNEASASLNDGTLMKGPLEGNKLTLSGTDGTNSATIVCIKE